MRVGELLRDARLAAELTQRELARRTGIAQPTIARIEAGRASPRIETLERLLAACGARLAVEPAAGVGIDRTQIRELLRLSPLQRLELLRRDAAGLGSFDAARSR
jgi:transcriptional regulator with XRE-family HTH domain